MDIESTLVGTVGDRLGRFYKEHDLGENGGEGDRWARVKMGWLTFYFPNTSSRKRALFFHDVHHLATGYNTDLRGESEIGAWEIASGCRDFTAAWLLNFFGFAMGLFIAPVRTYRAFIRGRQSRNFYHGLMNRETISKSTVAEIRQILELDGPPQRARPIDSVLFAIWSTPVLCTVMGFVAFVVWCLMS